MPRRTALAIGLASLASPATLNVVATPPAFAGEADEAIGTREWDFKTYKLIAPDVYDEVNVPLANPANGVASPTVLLLKDTRPTQAGNTIQLSKQQVPEGASRRCETSAPLGKPRRGWWPPRSSARRATRSTR